MNRIIGASLLWTPRIRPVAITLNISLLVGLLLRTLYLGNTFQTSDNVKLATKIVTNSGISWIFSENYGLLINILVLAFATTLSLLGITLTEFIWKLPIALTGTLQILVTYFFLRRLKLSSITSLLGSLCITVLPLHVMQSRYLWGYEVLGTLFVTLAIWTLLDFIDNPSATTGRNAGIMSGIYLISHGYILPYVPSLVVLILLYAGSLDIEKTRMLKRHLPQLAWMVPFFPFTIPAITHIDERETQFGIYIFDHTRGFIGNMGLFFIAWLLISMVMTLKGRIRLKKEALLFASFAFFYFAPLIFGVPPRATVVRGYMLIGIYFLVFLAVVIADQLLWKGNKWFLVFTILCILGTFWGTVESIFFRDQLFDPSMVIIERGDILPDPGSKTAGYLVQKYVPKSAKVLSIHGNLEPENFIYYFGRSQYAFNDLSFHETLDEFNALKNVSDVVICEEGHLNYIERERIFKLRTVIYSENTPRMWILTRDWIRIPVSSANVEEFNAAFDKEYSPLPALLLTLGR